MGDIDPTNSNLGETSFLMHQSNDLINSLMKFEGKKKKIKKRKTVRDRRRNVDN
jgi:hypothetical protein